MIRLTWGCVQSRGASVFSEPSQTRGFRPRILTYCGCTVERSCATFWDVCDLEGRASLRWRTTEWPSGAVSGYFGGRTPDGPCDQAHLEMESSASLGNRPFEQNRRRLVHEYLRTADLRGTQPCRLLVRMRPRTGERAGIYACMHGPFHRGRHQFGAGCCG